MEKRNRLGKDRHMELQVCGQKDENVVCQAHCKVRKERAGKGRSGSPGKGKE